MPETSKTGYRQNTLSELKRPPTNPEELRDFFDQGGIYELARPMEYLLEQGGYPIEECKITLTEDDDTGREFQAYWHYGIEQTDHRFLVVRSNLASLVGLYLSLPVELEEYKTSRLGPISASIVPPIVKGRSKVGHYLKQGAGLEIGKPAVAARVQRIASRHLLKACGVTKIEELDELAVPELSVA